VPQSPIPQWRPALEAGAASPCCYPRWPGQVKYFQLAPGYQEP